jgi:hypothetical protein
MPNYIALRKGKKDQGNYKVEGTGERLGCLRREIYLDSGKAVQYLDHKGWRDPKLFHAFQTAIQAHTWDKCHG